MARRHKIPAAALFCAALMALSACSEAPQQAQESNAESPGTDERPNIVIILVDDMGWSDIGAYGSEINTPNLDQLASQGLRFTQFRNTGKCFTSRASLLTGLYQHQVGMDDDPMGVLRNSVTLGEVLRSAGYRTLMVGKHHGGENPYDRGFDHYYGMRDGAGNYFNPGLQRAGEPVPAQKRPGQRTWCFDEECQQPFTPEDRDFYSTNAFTDWAIEFLERDKDEDKPFFLYLAYQAPHDPLQAPAEEIEKYAGVYDAGYEPIAEARYRRQRDTGLLDEKYARSTPTYPAWSSLTDAKKVDQARRMQVYAAMVDVVDQNVGRLVAKIEEMGELDNTLIMFASDNGGSAETVNIGDGEIGAIDRWSSIGGDWANVSNTPFRLFKNYSHEGGVNTSFVAFWPRGLKNPGRVSEYPGHFIDFMPTILDLSGADYPTEHGGQAVLPFEGQSFLPILQDKALERDAPMFFQWRRGRAVIDGRWKIVSYDFKKKDDPTGSDGDTWELYDLSTDKTEIKNIADQYPEVIDDMAKQYSEWRRRVGETP